MNTGHGFAEYQRVYVLQISFVNEGLRETTKQYITYVRPLVSIRDLQVSDMTANVVPGGIY